MLFTSRKTTYAETDGPVRYLDGSGLERPLSMPRSQRIVMGAFVAAAAVIGAAMLWFAIDAVHGNAARAQAGVEENLAREAPYDLPAVASLMAMSDDEIRQTFADAGFSMYETGNAEEDPDTYADGGFSEVKLPSDVSPDDAAVLLAGGMNKLGASDAALLMNGSWTIDVQRGEGVDIRVKFADFSSGDVETAVLNAMAAEGFDPATVADDGKGMDEAGNTYQTGTVESGGKTYAWRVSAIELSSVYKISGLPDDAVYVGIRVTD